MCQPQPGAALCPPARLVQAVRLRWRGRGDRPHERGGSGSDPRWKCWPVGRCGDWSWGYLFLIQTHLVFFQEAKADSLQNQTPRPIPSCTVRLAAAVAPSDCRRVFFQWPLACRLGASSLTLQAHSLSRRCDCPFSTDSSALRRLVTGRRAAEWLRGGREGGRWENKTQVVCEMASAPRACFSKSKSWHLSLKSHSSLLS